MTLRIGVIGTGDPDGEGFAMAYRHASGYQRLSDCKLVGCADIDEQNATKFAAAHDIPPEAIYREYQDLLADADPDIVSVCVPPAVHAEIVEDVAKSGVVGAIHCEKPMALTWADARRMTTVCDEADVQLTINHQLRFGSPYRNAKDLLESNAIGDLQRIEFREANLYDNGTHSFDLANYFTDHEPVEWVLGQVDYSEENRLFGAHNTNQAIVQWQYENGVTGLAATGRSRELLDNAFRLCGSEGVIEIGLDGTLTHCREGSSPRTIDTGVDGRRFPVPGPVRRRIEHAARTVAPSLAERLSQPTYTERAIEEIVTAYQTGSTSELDASYALDATEIIFAAWESVRRRGRVTLPLTIEDNPLEAMVESGALTPVSDQHEQTEAVTDPASDRSLFTRLAQTVHR